MGPDSPKPQVLATTSPTACRALPVTATKWQRRERHAAKMTFKKERNQFLPTGFFPGHLWRLP